VSRPDDEKDAARYRKLCALPYPEAARIMQYLKPDCDAMLDRYIEQFGPEPADKAAEKVK
jgi:hypothetical protein